MIYRYKILMSIVQEIGGYIEDTRLQALLFLFCNKFIENNHYYDFIKTINGPFSLQAKEDKKYLIKKGFLESADNWNSKEDAPRFAVGLNLFEKLALQKLKNRLQNTSIDELNGLIKNDYPEYFSNAEQEKNLIPMFCTIGYEGRSLENYINALVNEEIALLCDVRKNAYSQKFGFSKKELKSALNIANIEYKHIPELGICSQKRQNLDNRKAYNELFDEYERTTIKQQQAKLDELESLLNSYKRIAITCFEKEAYSCHRSRILKALKGRDSFDCLVKNL